MVRLNVSLDDLRNCKERTMFVKKREKSIECKKKRIFNLAYKQGLLFEKSKLHDKFNEMYKKNGTSKSRKSVRKVSITRSSNNF